ncbi:fasciclin domain-containing protein [Erythrobacter litoralis]|uniref:FAS1 domain-containing protein n=1 Tax=Erythrobacter litoralis (strain HTCC2594) TaxID=314225 RepID=Q2ND19_ERYLH|nr:fasciclin domain-containing protein [Erythrobacter litoralis]ABC62422.1 hypothetical protein ELI_01650 [Erythrobacter litoralis HTCC2594]
MRTITILPALLAATALAACGDADPSGAPEAISDNLSVVLEDTDELSTVRNAMEATGLASLLHGPGTSYTIIAPSDAAFAEITGDEDLEPPVLAALLREHIVPGHLDREAIVSAIESNGGPVRVATVGQGTLEFSHNGDDLLATHSESGLSARMTGAGGQAENGTLLVVDAVLTAPPARDAAA